MVRNNKKFLSIYLQTLISYYYDISLVYQLFKRLTPEEIETAFPGFAGGVAGKSSSKNIGDSKLRKCF